MLLQLLYKQEFVKRSLGLKFDIMMNLVIFGGPGSGKGTQSARLINKYGLYHISTGELLRDHIRRGTDIGKTAEKYISNGQLIPDGLMIDIIKDVLDREARDKKGIILDGFPRTIKQAEALEEFLKSRGTDVHAVIGLEVPDEELADRLIKRAAESGRSDDNPETIRKRLDVYHSQTTPLREHYIGKDKYIPINGTGNIDEIFEAIKEGLEKKNTTAG